MSRLGRNPFEKSRPTPLASAPIAAESEIAPAAPAPTFTAATAVENRAPREFTKAPQEDAPLGTPPFKESDEILELSSLRDFIVKDIPAAALMLAIKGALRWSERQGKSSVGH